MPLDFSPIADAPMKAMQQQQYAAEMAAYGDAQQEQRYQNRLIHMKNQDALRLLEVNKMVDSGVGANMLMQQASGAPPPPPPPAAPPTPMQNTLAPKLMTNGIGAGQMLPGADPSLAPGAPPPAGPAAPPQQSALDMQMTTYRKLREDNKIDDAEYGKLATAAITGSNAQVAAGLEEFGKLTEMVKKGGGPAKFGELVNSGFFDGIAPPATLQKLKSIDYSKMKAEADFTEYELPGGGKLVSGRDADGKAYTHILPATDKTMTTEQLTSKALQEKLGRPPTATEIKTELSADKERASVPAEIKTFEAVTGQRPEQRGTAEYKKALLKWDQEHKSALHITVANPSDAGTQPFSKWSADEKKVWFDMYKLDKTAIPPFGIRDSGSKRAFGQEFAQYVKTGKTNGSNVVMDRADLKANNDVIRDIKKRDALVGTFTGKIEANTKYFEQLRSKYGSNWNKMINTPVNALTQYMGSGDLAALKLVLKSTSNEVAKVESGSLGVAEVSIEQAKEMAKIHDMNLPMGEIMKVLKTGMQLGRNTHKANRDQIADLQRQRTKGDSSSHTDATPPSTGGSYQDLLNKHKVQ